MNTFDIILQQVGLFVIYILAGLLLVKSAELGNFGTDFKICYQNGIAADGFY